MPTVLNNPTQIGSKVWRYTWTGTAPYRIYNYSTYAYHATKFNGTSIDIPGTSEIEPPAIEVFGADETDDPDGVTNPAQIFLQWRGVAYAKEYQVYNAAASTVLATVPESGLGYYKFLGQAINEDQSSGSGNQVSYSVRVVDSQGNVSDISAQSFFLDRNPDPPIISIAYNSGTNTFTITPSV